MPSMNNFGMPHKKSLNFCLVNMLLLEKLANIEGLAALKSICNGFSGELWYTRKAFGSQIEEFSFVIW